MYRILRSGPAGGDMRLKQRRHLHEQRCGDADPITMTPNNLNPTGPNVLGGSISQEAVIRETYFVCFVF